jgi:eukaryotic-like serine/threonine-protein kinase
MESPEHALVPGYRLDRYELLCPIASGGMATVWLARLRGKRGFEKLFAIKTIKTELISDPNFQDMFMDEARIASRIVHPNVAQILELGEQDDILYIVMEHVDGEAVAKIHRLALTKGAPLPPGVAMRIVADACAGLHAAHQLTDSDGENLGVVHRDVSPQNILLTTNGESKVIDFGLVKAKKRGAAETQSGVVKGKIRYMAPEQVGPRGVDRRSDVWAAGMCLYELMSGEIPYAEHDDLAVVKLLMSDDPLPKRTVSLPEPIERILRKAIAREPEDRFESCSAMRRAIENAIDQLGLSAENEDVGRFLAETMPELAEKRRRTIAKAIALSDSKRPSGAEPIDADIGYAITEVVSRDPPSSGKALVLTRKRSPVRLDSNPEQNVAGYTPHGSLLRDQLGERGRRGTGLYLLAAVAVAGVATWLLWPRSHAESPTLPIASAPQTPPPSTDPLPPPSAPLIELDQLPNASGPGSPLAADTRPKGAASSRPRPATSASATVSDGGLSPAALSAAKVMLTHPPGEASPGSSAGAKPPEEAPHP